MTRSAWCGAFRARRLHQVVGDLVGKSIARVFKGGVHCDAFSALAAGSVACAFKHSTLRPPQNRSVVAALVQDHVIHEGKCPACPLVRKKASNAIKPGANGKERPSRPLTVARLAPGFSQELATACGLGDWDGVDEVRVCPPCCAKLQREFRKAPEGARAGFAAVTTPQVAGDGVRLTHMPAGQKHRAKVAPTVNLYVDEADDPVGDSGAAATPPTKGELRRRFPHLKAAAKHASRTMREEYEDMDVDTRVFSAADVTTSLNFSFSAVGAVCPAPDCGEPLSVVLARVKRGVQTATTEVAHACDSCGHVLQGRTVALGLCSVPTKTRHYVDAMRMSAGKTSVTSNLEAFSSAVQVAPHRVTVQRAAQRVTDATLQLAADVQGVLLQDVRHLLQSAALLYPEASDAASLAALAAASPIYFSFDGFYNSLANRSAQWCGISVHVHSLHTREAQVLMAFSLASLTKSATALPAEQAAPSNAAGLELLAAQRVVKLFRDAGIGRIPVMVCDQDAGVSAVFRGFAAVVTADANHYMKSVGKQLVGVSAGAGSLPSCEQLKSVTKRAVREEVQNLAQRKQALGKAGVAALHKAHEGPCSLPPPEAAAAETLSEAVVEDLHSAALGRGERHGVPPITQLLLLTSVTGTAINNAVAAQQAHDAALQLLDLHVDAEALGEAVVASGGVGVAPHSDVAGAVDAAVAGAAVAGAYRKLPAAAVGNVLKRRTRRNILQAAGKARGDLSWFRHALAATLAHARGDHSACSAVYSACTPTQPPVVTGGALDAFMSSVIAHFFGAEGEVKLEALGVLLRLSSNACESFGAMARSYVPKNISFRRRWPEGVAKAFLDRTVGDAAWRELLLEPLGIAQTPAQLKFYEERCLRRLEMSDLCRRGLRSALLAGQKAMRAAFAKLGAKHSVETYGKGLSEEVLFQRLYEAAVPGAAEALDAPVAAARFERGVVRGVAATGSGAVRLTVTQAKKRPRGHSRTTPHKAKKARSADEGTDSDAEVTFAAAVSLGPAHAKGQRLGWEEGTMRYCEASAAEPACFGLDMYHLQARAWVQVYCSEAGVLLRSEAEEDALVLWVSGSTKTCPPQRPLGIVCDPEEVPAPVSACMGALEASMLPPLQ